MSGYARASARASERVWVLGLPKGEAGYNRRQRHTHPSGSIRPIKALHASHGPLRESLVCPSVCANMNLSVPTSSTIDLRAQDSNGGGSATGESGGGDWFGGDINACGVTCRITAPSHLVRRERLATHSES
ncbi:hypothetical protein ECG_08967 [Echinococcus granulosus]|nr:hypothetical protein ECG_08965 [Echinococcus granulosus]KAH9278416.1 hypothetical protein ECG_08967 [Echinococcus granulosus]